MKNKTLKLSEMLFPTRQDAINHIKHARGSDIADEDVVEDETGEVFLSAGDRYDRSELHPQYVRKNKNVLSDEEIEVIDSSSDMPDDEVSSETAFDELDAAMQEFAMNFEGDTQIEPGDIPDCAQEFFANYPNWRAWATATGMSQREIKDAVSDAIADAVYNDE